MEEIKKIQEDNLEKKKNRLGSRLDLLTEQIGDVDPLLLKFGLMSSLSPLEVEILKIKHLTRRGSSEDEPTWNKVLTGLHSKFATYSYDKSKMDELTQKDIDELRSELRNDDIKFDLKYNKNQLSKLIIRKKYPEFYTSVNELKIPSSVQTIAKIYRIMMDKLEGDIVIYKILYDFAYEGGKDNFLRYMVKSNKTHLLIKNLYDVIWNDEAEKAEVANKAALQNYSKIRNELEELERSESDKGVDLSLLIKEKKEELADKEKEVIKTRKEFETQIHGKEDSDSSKDITGIEFSKKDWEIVLNTILRIKDMYEYSDVLKEGYEYTIIDGWSGAREHKPIYKIIKFDPEIEFEKFEKTLKKVSEIFGL